MEVFMIILATIVVLWAIISGLIAIVRTWRYCIAMGSSSQFISYVFKQTGGSWVGVIGIIVLCIPIWIFLSAAVAVKKNNNPNYYKYVQLMNDSKYIAAFDLCIEEYRNTNNWDTATAKGVDYLIKNNISKDVAVENMNLIVLIRILSQIKK
ncbi:MAG: hypothetical protein LBK94_03675 [Prevotellaceae bacterium]|jgi:hypothetical protein|nr:hypothetical protein [Prevotellaceae bacterium]